jgi:DNA-binding IclR family transcriptional regulator
VIIKGKIDEATGVTLRTGGYDFGLREMLSEVEEKPSDAKFIRRIAIMLACICNGINSLADISDQTKLSRSTVHRLLKGMEKSRMISHDPGDRRYYLGSLIRHLISKPLVTHEYLVNCAEKEMERLAAVTEETVMLGIKIGLNHVTIHAVPSVHDLRIVEPTKRVGPLYVSAGAKVLLSQLDESELKEVLKNIQPEPNTHLDKAELLAQVKQIQRQGYCITSGEKVFGATCVSAPIKGYETPAALSILGPDARLKPRITSSIKHLLAAVDRISRDLMDQ